MKKRISALAMMFCGSLASLPCTSSVIAAAATTDTLAPAAPATSSVVSAACTLNAAGRSAAHDEGWSPTDPVSDAVFNTCAAAKAVLSAAYSRTNQEFLDAANEMKGAVDEHIKALNNDEQTLKDALQREERRKRLAGEAEEREIRLTRESYEKKVCLFNDRQKVFDVALAAQAKESTWMTDHDVTTAQAAMDRAEANQDKSWNTLQALHNAAKERHIQAEKDGVKHVYEMAASRRNAACGAVDRVLSLDGQADHVYSMAILAQGADTKKAAVDQLSAAVLAATSMRHAVKALLDEAKTEHTKLKDLYEIAFGAYMRSLR